MSEKKTFIIEIATESGDRYFVKAFSTVESLPVARKKAQELCWVQEGSDEDLKESLDVYFRVSKVIDVDSVTNPDSFNFIGEVNV